MGRKKRRPSDRSKWTITDWQGWLWPLFSRYIRLRDCIKTTGTTDWGLCRTCQRKYHFKRLQAGHFIPGRMRAVLFDPRCVHIQCYRCNRVIKEVWPAYYRFMQKEYGQELVEELIDLYMVDAELTPEWFEQSYKYYEWCVDEMLRTGQLVEGTPQIATG